jgi:hypothetical protein
MKNWSVGAVVASLVAGLGTSAHAQMAPSAVEVAAYEGLHKAAATGDGAEIERLAKQNSPLESRDGNGRTPFIVAAYRGQSEAMERLAAAGTDVNALDAQAYDAVTIAAVANDIDTLKTALRLGNKATNITSPYNGTALIAAAHLGHHQAVKLLIEAGAPLDHVNNLGWTALIEAVVLGDGGSSHQETVAALVTAGADRGIADQAGQTPLQLAEARGYAEMVKLLKP